MRSQFYGLARILGTVEHDLAAIRRYFLYAYFEQVQRLFPLSRSFFPLANGSRLDLVQVNGGNRVHFLYRDRDDGQHHVVIHDVMMDAADQGDSAERRFVQRALRVDDSVAHFVLRPPFRDRFEDVDRLAAETVVRNAKQLADA